MPSKSENYYLKLSIKRGLFFGLFGVVSFGTFQVAHALDVTPAPPWALVNGNSVYYQYYAGSGTAPVMDRDFAYFDFSRGSAAHTASAPTILYFDIATSKDFPTPAPSPTPGVTAGTPTLVAQVFTNRQNSGSPAAIPIIQMGSPSSVSNCDGSICQKYDSTSGFYYAAHFTAGQTLRIGLNLQDLCSEMARINSSLPAVGCSNGTFAIPTSSAPTTSFALTFYVSYAPNTTDLGVTDSTADSVQRSLVAQLQGPSLSGGCSTDNIYFPGDGEIGLSTTGVAGFVAGSGNGAAPAVNFIVVGKRNASPVVWNNFWAGNDIVARFPYSSGRHTVTGFKNTTSEEDNYYDLVFGVADAAGAIATTPACTLLAVRTADIQGFLNKGNCFIATGAFRSIDAGPVVLLREFRDRFLLSSPEGRRFVNWYYTWSPAKAKWLMRHPEFQIPVLRALLPLEIFAWFVLHPSVAFVTLASLLLMTVGLMMALRFGPGRRRL